MADDDNKTDGSGAPVLAPEVIEQLQKLNADWTNNGFTSRASAWEKRLEKKLEEKFDKFSSMLQQQPKTAGSGKKSKDEEGVPDTVAYNSLQAKMQELETRYAQAEANAKAARAQIQMRDLRKMAEQEFVAAGGDPSMSEYVLDHLIDAKKRLVVEEDGDEYRFVFKKEDGTEIDPKTGIKEFMKSEKAKPFSKAKPVNGSGSRITNNFSSPKSGGKAAADQALADIIFGGFGGGKFNE